MGKMKQITRGIGKVILALLGGVLMPILIWVALGVAVYKKVYDKRVQRELMPTIGEILVASGLTIQGNATTDKAVAAKTFMQQPVSEIGEFLARAGITIHHEAAPRHCWDILHCPPEKRGACSAYTRRDIPCWVAIGLGKGGRISEVCVNCTPLDLKAQTLQA